MRLGRARLSPPGLLTEGALVVVAPESSTSGVGVAFGSPKGASGASVVASVADRLWGRRRRP